MTANHLGRQLASNIVRLFSRLLASVLLSGVVLLPQSLTADGSASSTSSAAFSSILNGYRASHGVGPLSPDAELSAAAQAYAKDMVSRGYFSHTGRDGSNAMVRASMAGCSWRSIGENLAAGYTTNDQVIRGWDRSSSHRRTMLGRGYTRYGVGRVGTTWVLMFADRC